MADESPLLIELDGLTRLITSPEWKHFIAILRKHEDWLDSRIHVCIKNREFDEAACCQARKNDTSKILQLLQKRLDELKTVPRNKP